MPLVLLVLLPWIGSLVAVLFPSNARNAEATVASLIALAALVQACLWFPDVAAGQVIEQRIGWLPSMGLDLVFRMDGFAWLFTVLVLGIGALVALYARYYMSPADPVPRFFAFLMSFMGAMIGVVLSGNLIQLVLFWELTSIYSFLLIGYWHQRDNARKGARMALLVTGMGGLGLLIGALLLGHVAGSYELDVVLASGDLIRQHDLYGMLLVFILLGALTKSAQFPFLFWLPRAMAAPTPVSAYLHSATMVKLGVFLLARFWPVLSGTQEWFVLVGGAGAASLLVGAYIAMFQTDLKGLLAYSSISHLGLITLLLGMNSKTAAVAAVFHIINHATFKASLFMAAGIIDHETGTRDMGRLSGLMKSMPVTGTLAFVASAAMAGVPLLNGFLSKEMFFAATVDVDSSMSIEVLLPVMATVAAMFSVTYSLRLSVDVFLGPRATGLPREPHEPVHWMRVPVELLVIVCLLVGILPATIIGAVLDTAAKPVVGGSLPSYSLALWHGWNLPMAMSLAAMVGGVLIWMLLRDRMRKNRFEGVPLLRHINGQAAFARLLIALRRLGANGLNLLGTRRLQQQLFLIIFVGAVLVGLILYHDGLRAGPRIPIEPSPVFMGLWLIGGICAVGAAWQAKYHRLAALMMMSIAGLVTCLTFILFSAPDLALTQLTVEVVTTVLFLLGLRWLPKRIEDMHGGEPRLPARVRARRSRDLVLAVVVGAGLALLSYAIMTREFPQSISPFFLARALPEGGGTNVVNVMLVDFRGYDTLGEITVLSAVALAVYALLRRFRPPRESSELPSQQRLPPDIVTDLVNPKAAADTALGYMMVPAVLVRLLQPMAAAVALYLLMRGHNQPGGGFIAGLVVAIGFILQYMVAGTQWVESHMKLHPPRWVAYGLLTAGFTGLGACMFGYPFLTTHTAHADLPGFGEVHLPSAMFFDIGVFAVVVGATMLILTALSHQSIRRTRRSVPEEPSADAKPVTGEAQTVIRTL
ncbi:MAG: monovalent cation/H+ antiporter subunit A [Lautropia sp.]|nr:monovalent cation/H+ antiporter subunit A [Lautropia sp.]